MMRRVLVLQHSPRVEPGFFGQYLTAQHIAWDWVRIDQGQPVPASLAQYSGLGLMGGEMSVNDPLPWIDAVCELIRQADAHNKPVIGHCLGGQLIARAFGAVVRPHVRKELGWGRVQIQDSRLGQEWLGQSSGQIPVFQWHGETFDWPSGAEPLLVGEYCERQAYVIPRQGRVAHLGLQCHPEMTPELVEQWAQSGAEEVRQALAQDAAAVQNVDSMRIDAAARCDAMHVYTRRLYDRWVEGLEPVESV